jgi:hypothetical protein
MLQNLDPIAELFANYHFDWIQDQHQSSSDSIDYFFCYYM